MNVIAKLFSSPRLNVQWDDTVKANLKPPYIERNSTTLSIRLIRLLIDLGSVQPRRVKSSLTSSLLDYGYLIERLYDTPDLRVKVAETRDKLSSEMLTEMSELMGVGLSVVVVSSLFDIQPSTIERIKGRSSKRPDWRCLLKDNRILIVEAKGSISKDTSKQQLKEAVRQKGSMAGDIGIASGTVLNEFVISELTIIDPPVSGNDDNDINRRYVFRANHYSSVFSFLGEDVLSLYFDKMAKRLAGSIGGKEMDDKELMFNQLYYKTPDIILDNKEYVGHLYGVDQGQYCFIGVDKRLLSYSGFIEFQDAVDEMMIEKGGNHYLISPDGILVVNVLNSEVFFKENSIQYPGVKYDRIVLKDLDSIRGNSFKRYVKYLLDKCCGETRWADNGALMASVEGEEKAYFIYHVHNTKRITPSLKTLENLAAFMNGRKGVLVTNLRIPSEKYNGPYVDRNAFERIVDNDADQRVLKEVFWL